MRIRRPVSQPPTRRGFTLIELLVVISIIAVLMSLILPAIQNAREAGRRTQCLNNLHNLSLAAHTYATARKGRLPSYGYWVDHDADPTTAAVPNRSWVVELLPFLDQSQIYDRWNKNDLWNGVVATPGFPETNVDLGTTVIAVLTCPNNTLHANVGGALSYAVNAGYGDVDFATGHNYNIEPIDWGSAGGSLAGDELALNRDTGVMWADVVGGTRNKSQTLDSIYDGAANTIMMTENVNISLASWANPDPQNVLFMLPLDVSGTTPAMGSNAVTVAHDATTTPYINETKGGPVATSPYPNSLHPGGVNYANCEGGASFLNETIDASVYQRLITPGGTRIRQAIAGFVPEGPLNSDF